METIPFSKFTLQDLAVRYGISLQKENFTPDVSPVTIPDWLIAYLRIFADIPQALQSEKAISEPIIAISLVHL